MKIISTKIYLIVSLFLVFFSYRICAATTQEDVVSAPQNFHADMSVARSYGEHEKLAQKYRRAGRYDEAIVEYEKALDIIQNVPDEMWSDVSKAEMDRINWESKVRRQLFSRYGLIEALDGAGRYEEAIENVEWLMRYQRIKGKEEFLRSKLQGMKSDLERKIAAKKQQQ